MFVFFLARNPQSIPQSLQLWDAEFCTLPFPVTPLPENGNARKFLPGEVARPDGARLGLLG
jgi:hypothetical protein